MHSFSVLTIAQMLLIIVGVIFQVVAMSWLFRDTSSERGDGQHDDWAERKIDLSPHRRPVTHAPLRDAVRDYYEIENTPPGVRPADLRARSPRARHRARPRSGGGRDR